MKKMMKVAVCGMVLVASLGLGMIAEAGSIPTNKLPLHTYAIRHIDCYKAPGGARQGYIDPGDYVIVTQIRSGWAYGSYPTKNGRVSRWFKANDLVNNVGFANQERFSPKNNTYVYKNPSHQNNIGSFWGNEPITVVSDSGNSRQVIYKISGGYKMGWVPYWDCWTQAQAFGSGATAGINAAISQFDWPIPGCKKITTIYTYNSGGKHSCRYYSGGKWKSNTTPWGIDISAPEGTKVYAPAGGIVQEKNYQSSGFGKNFEIKHDDGTITLYAHLSNYDYVWNGKRVNKGDLIALSGNTGNSKGAHLHFEMSNKDTYQCYKGRGVL